MLKKDLMFRNPLRIVGEESKDLLPTGGFGAVLARAGVGKTAMLVQIAMDSLLQGRNVLHISLRDPVKKVCLWYEEVFRKIAEQYDIKPMDQLWEAILPHRLIMAFQKDTFQVDKLAERLTELSEQDIFIPQVILVDGLGFGPETDELTSALKKLASDNFLGIWFTIRIHREEDYCEDGMPVSFDAYRNLFDFVFQLLPEGKQIQVRILQAPGGEPYPKHLHLDPTTMLIQEKPVN